MPNVYPHASHAPLFQCCSMQVAPTSAPTTAVGGARPVNSRERGLSRGSAPATAGRPESKGPRAYMLPVPKGAFLVSFVWRHRFIR